MRYPTRYINPIFYICCSVQVAVNRYLQNNTNYILAWPQMSNVLEYLYNHPKKTKRIIGVTDKQLIKLIEKEDKYLWIQ